MFTHHIAISNCTGRKFELSVLALFSVSGTVLGVLAAYKTDPVFFSMMRIAPYEHVSIVDLFFATLFPYLITAVVSFLSKPHWLFPLIFLKSFGYSLTLCSVWVGYYSVGWLVATLLMASDTCAVLLLYWYWIRNISGFRETSVNDFLFAVGVSLAASVIDALCISPYLADLMKY